MNSTRCKDGSRDPLLSLQETERRFEHMEWPRNKCKLVRNMHRAYARKKLSLSILGHILIYLN